MALSKTLNEEQQAAYNEIMSTFDSDHGSLFFMGGPGGTGKTCLYRALLATIRSWNKIVVATTTSGVAISIMPGGRTAHLRFKIPLILDDGAFCTFTKQSGTAKLLQTTSLIIWDEVTMIKRQGVEVLDNNLYNIMDHPNLPFGGRLWCLVKISGRFSQLFEEGQGLK
jgi:ABC-type ATPase involved in cell division